MTDFPLVRGRRIRVTKLDGCGRPVLGPDSRVVTSGFVTVAFAPNNTTIDPITVTNASGEECVNEPGSSKFSSYGVTGTFCKVMPELFSMITGMPVVKDAAGAQAIGIRVNSQIDVDLTGFALEVWSKVPQQICADTDTAPAYGYTVAPFVKGGVLGGITFENAAVTFTLESATTQDGNDWAAGPYNVELNESSVAGPLNTALDPYDHLEMIKVNVAPPDETDGAAALGVAATSGVAGIPGHTNPTNSYAPANLAGASGLTASPTTAWTTGQYITLRDGTKAHWTGSAWAAGAA